ncbi:MAG: single-stranded-DNA-specific exonuclease RecJ [Rhodocyclaceae bacterium]|nr:single-stranded-DNA-specific exonuclease RecJ [Rhodocyclaceae bacterium]
MSTRIVTRAVPIRSRLLLEQSGIHPLLSRLYAARGITKPEEIETTLNRLLPPSTLKGAEEAARLLADALIAGKKMLIVADYDCDGATACAVGLRALRTLGADVDYLVPDRFTLGYGLSPEVVHLAALHKPELLITVDNGIGSCEGVAEAKRLGMTVIITDHHLPGPVLPDADVIVNPCQPGCSFQSKSMAGVGVMFYVMLALRSELRKRGFFVDRPEPNLATLLDLVALGTIADVVSLDHNNRVLVAQGLARIRKGLACAGLTALFRITGRDPARATIFDLGFALGPRINAVGRLADMRLGIECLSTDNEAPALNMVGQLDAINRERRDIEVGMQEIAEAQLAQWNIDQRTSLVLFDSAWHQGVVGILAGRIKDRHHRPTFAFAPGHEDSLRGSGRSIPGLHLRDALDLVAKRHPGMLLRFGGHAAAAGVTIPASRLTDFTTAFDAVCTELLKPADMTHTLETDGPLESGYFSIDAVRLLNDAVWGQGFPAPMFSDRFEVISQRVLKEKHLKLVLKKGNVRFDAIRFNDAQGAPDQIHAVFQPNLNEWKGVTTVQLTLEHFESA